MTSTTGRNVLAAGLWLLAWQLGSTALAAAYPHGELLLASPLRVLRRLGELLPSAAFWQTAGRSAGGIFGGFLLACLLAVLLAALAAGRPWLQALLAPPVAAAKAVPVASFIILALVWLDARTLPVFISALMVFPPIYLHVLEGIRQRDPKLLELSRLYRVPFRRRVRYLDLPQVLPYFRSAASLALGLCWKAGAAAEVIGLSSGTIGERLYTAKIYLQTPDLFAWTLVIVTLSALSGRLFLALIGLAAKAPAVSHPAPRFHPPSRRAAAQAAPDLPLLEVRGLCKSFGLHAVLKDLSFTAGPGITCITAPSGRGKTTLLRLLLGLERPDGGKITCRCRWAAVFQEDRLLEDLDAAANLRFALAPEDLPRAAALLERMGLDPADPRPLRAWSGGMRRRLSLALALAAPAQALALDEPFTGLDRETRACCLACVREAAETRLILLTTHDPSGLEDLPALRLPPE